MKGLEYFLKLKAMKEAADAAKQAPKAADVAPVDVQVAEVSVADTKATEAAKVAEVHAAAAEAAGKQGGRRSRKPRKSLPEGYMPSEAELKKYCDGWDHLPGYVAHEAALNMIFRNDPTFAANTDMRHVIVKCSVLNDFYATNIYSIFPVAEHIVNIADFDARLAAGDDSLVEEIATVDGRRNYSFATKYCSHHRPDLFPIYDQYVDKVLRELRRRNPAAFRFTSADELKNYPSFRGAIDDFRKAYALEQYSYKDVDRYLWQLGKEFYNPYKD